MLTLLLKLIDRIIDLAKLRISDRQQLFKDIAEPLFLQVQPAVDDYFEVFRKARNSLLEGNGSPSSLNAIVIQFRRDREKYVHLRRQIEEMAATVQQNIADKHLAEFTTRIVTLFHSTDVESKHKSDSVRVLNFFNFVLEDLISPSDMERVLVEILNNLEQRWIALAQSYAALRIYCLAPPRFTKSKLSNEEVRIDAQT